MRLPLLLVMLVGALLAPAASAAAEDESEDRIVMAWGALPPGVDVVQLGSCRDPFGPEPVPAPEHGWSIRTAPGESPYSDDVLSTGPSIGLRFGVPGLDRLEVLSVSTLGGADGRGLSYARAAIDLTVGGRHWRLTTFAQAPKLGWQRHHLTNYRWDDLDTADEEQPIGSVAEFVAAHGDAPAQVRILTTGCDEAGAVDGLEWGPTGGSTTYDIERSDTSMIVSRPATENETWVYCALATFESGQLWSHVLGRTLTLLARPYGATHYRVIHQAAGNPGIGLRVRPTTNTVYRCRFDGDPSRPAGPTHAPALSDLVRVTAPHQLSIGTVVRGHRVLALGRTRPVHPGTALKLVARRADGRVVGVMGTVRGDGTYRIRASLGTGRWRVRVIEAATPSNTRGHSPVRTVRVR